MEAIKKYTPGIIFVLIISIISMQLDHVLKTYISLEAVTIAIIIGILYNNTIGTQESLKPGTTYSLKKLLKVGIVLLGFKLNISAIMELGPKVIIMVVIFVPVVLLLANVLGKLFKVNTKLATLLGVGSSICGASAIVALTPCIHGDDEDSVIAVSIISLLGAVGVMAYSAIATSQVGLTTVQYGTWSGLSLQGVAHAIAAAFALGSAAGQVGTFVKMTRVLMLVPVSIVLSYIFSKESGKTQKAKFPMYVFYFILAGIINGTGIIPDSITWLLTKASSILILMSMTAMGLSVHIKSVIGKGLKALACGTVLFLIISIGSLLIIMNVM